MSARLVACTKCRAPLPPAFYDALELRPCPACGAPSLVAAFPIILRPQGPGSTGQTVLVEGEASCFYHPTKQAVVPCAHCGRFLCLICDVEMEGAHWCPGCLETGRKKGRLQQLDRRRTLHDSVALAVAVFPMLLVWPTILSAPIAIYIAVRYWKAPSSILRRSKWRAVLAIIIATLQIAGWILLFLVVRNR